MSSQEDIRSREDYYAAVFVAVVRNREEDISDVSSDSDAIDVEEFSDTSIEEIRSDMEDVRDLVTSVQLDRDIRKVFAEALLEYHAGRDMEMFGMDVSDELSETLESVAEEIIAD